MHTLPPRLGWSFLLCASLAAAWPRAAGGAPITFAFRGTVTEVQAQPGAHRTPEVDWPEVGSTFAGTYVYDPGAWDHANGPIHVSIGDFHWSSSNSMHTVMDTLPGVGAPNAYGVGDGIPGMAITSPPELASAFDRWNFGIALVGDLGFLSSYSPPRTPPNLSAARVKQFTLTGDTSLNTTPVPVVRFTGPLESLTLVPEPTGAGVLCAAAPLLLSRRRRQ